MSSSIKLILETDLHIDQNTGTFDLNFGEKDNNGKADIFLSKNDDVLINMLRINIDTNSQDASYRINNSLENKINLPDNPLDIYSSSFLTAELDYNPLVNKIQALENELDQTTEITKEYQIPHITNLHMNYKQNRYGLYSIERANIHSQTRTNTCFSNILQRCIHKTEGYNYFKTQKGRDRLKCQEIRVL